MAFTLDTPLGTLLDHPQAKPIIDKHVPGLSTNPMTGMVKGLTLNQILAMPQAAQIGLTKEKVEAVLAEVNKYVK
jgi:beta-glucosidase